MPRVHRGVREDRLTPMNLTPLIGDRAACQAEACLLLHRRNLRLPPSQPKCWCGSHLTPFPVRGRGGRGGPLFADDLPIWRSEHAEILHAVDHREVS